MKHTLLLPPSLLGEGGAPPISLSLTTIDRWLKPVGGVVQIDEPLLIVRTPDRLLVAVPSSASGVLVRVLAQPGETIEPGEPLAVLSGFFVAPGSLKAPPMPEEPGEDAESVALSTSQRRLGEHMVQSKRTAPHVSTVIAVDATEIVRLAGSTLDSPLPFVLKAVADALTRFPDLNARLAPTAAAVLRYRGIHLAARGAVIRDADRKSVLAIARELADPFDTRGATFTVTEHVAFVQTPILRQPQAALLSVGRVEKTPAVIDDAIVIRHRLHLSLTHDARLIDDATAAHFLDDIRQSLEETRFLFA